MKAARCASSLQHDPQGVERHRAGPVSEPPRKQAAAMLEMTTMSMYSAMKNEPKRMPPYSVL